MTKKQCLFPKCEQSVYCRGLCFNHYREIMKMVKSGVANEETLIANGKILLGRSNSAKVKKEAMLDWLNK